MEGEPINPNPHLKPRMGAQEASWCEHIAGMRAAQAAREQGADPLAVRAVGTATAGPVVIAGHPIKPATQGTVWTLQRAARMFSSWADEAGMEASGDPENPGTREMLELGLTTLIFSDARSVWRALDAGGFPGVMHMAEAVIWDMPLEDSRALQTHFEAQMETIRRLAGEEAPAPEKKPEAGGKSAAMPIPPEDADSPRWSGSPPSTESPSPMPCGPNR